MSQSSQTSSMGFSQETLEHLWRNINEIFPNEQVGLQMGSAPMPSLHLSDENIHENVEMTLESVGIMRQGEGQMIPQQYNMGSQHAPPVALLLPVQNGNCGHLQLKKEHHTDDIYAMQHLTTPPPCNQLADSHCLPSPHAQLIVSNTDFPGSMNLKVELEKETSYPTKSAQWTYSQQLKKLFVKMKCLVPIKIGLQGVPPPGACIKVVVIYKQPEHYREIAERCPNHITKHKDGHPAPMHIMRCENPSTQYDTCHVTGRHSLRLLVSTPAAGTDFFTEMFQFMCFSSCPGGLNRRPIQAIFTLEIYGQVLGRKALDLRICACPGRDRTNEEFNDNKKKYDKHEREIVDQPTTPASTGSPQRSAPPTPSSTTPAPISPPQLPSTSTENVTKPTRKRANQYVTNGFEVTSINMSKRLKVDEKEKFTIHVEGRETYELLMKIKESLDLMKLVPQAQVDAYRASCIPSGLLNTSHNQQNSDSQKSTDSNDSEHTDTPPDTFPLSQLTRSDSGASQGSQTSQGGVANAVRFTLRRTVSLERKGHH